MAFTVLNLVGSQAIITHKCYSSHRTVGTQTRDSSVGTATCYGLDGRGLIPGRGKRFPENTKCIGRLSDYQLFKTIMIIDVSNC
jgi:hypothetical protein